MTADDLKKAAAAAAVELVRDGQKLGLGTGSTANHFIDLLAQRVKQGLKVEVFPEKAKLGKQLGYADTDVGAAVAAILGEDEAATAEITLKHLKSGEQTRVKLAEAGAVIEGWRGATAS